MAVDLGRSAVPQRGVFLGRDAREDADLAAAQGLGRYARVLQRLPGHLEQHPLLRVHRQRLARADAKEVRVELVRVVQERTVQAVRLAVGLGIEAEDGVRVSPAAVGGEAGDGLPAVGYQLPQVLRRTYVTWKPARHGHDGNRRPVLLLELAYALPGIVQVGDSSLEVTAKLFLVRHLSPEVSSGGRTSWQGPTSATVLISLRLAGSKCAVEYILRSGS